MSAHAVDDEASEDWRATALNNLNDLKVKQAEANGDKVVRKGLSLADLKRLQSESAQA